MANKLTPEQIASMSEVVAKYMGWEIWCTDRVDTYFKRQDSSILFYTPDFIDFNLCHDVWEKVRDEECKKAIRLYNLQKNIASKLVSSTHEQCFIALFEAIKFIEQLKQENNGKENV